MKGFLQVASLFGIPLAIVIWYDLSQNPDGYLGTYSFGPSRYVALGIYLVLAFLCLHTPLHLWRRFNELNVKKFSLMAALSIFWVSVRLVSTGRVEFSLIKTAAVFLIPIIAYAILSTFLVKWSRPEFEDASAVAPEPDLDNDDDHGNS